MEIFDWMRNETDGSQFNGLGPAVLHVLCSHPKPTPLAFPTPLFLGKCHQWNGAACATYFRSSSNCSKHLLLQAPFNSFSIQMNHSKQLLTTFQFDQLKFSLNQLRFISSLIPDASGYMNALVECNFIYGHVYLCTYPIQDMLCIALFILQLALFILQFIWSWIRYIGTYPDRKEGIR